MVSCLKRLCLFLVQNSQDRAISVSLSLVSKVEEQSAGFMSRFVQMQEGGINFISFQFSDDQYTREVKKMP